MQLERNIPDQQLGTLGPLGNRLQKCSSLESLKQAHTQIIINGFQFNNYLAVRLVSCCKSLGLISYAQLIFNGLRKTANLFLWTSMVGAYAQLQHCSLTKQSIITFKHMLRTSIKPNNYTLSSVLKACSFLGAGQEGKQIHAVACKLGLSCDDYVQTTLVDMYAKTGHFQSAAQLFDAMHERNITVCNALIVTCSKAGYVEQARQIFDGMDRRDSISWTVMMCGYTNHGSMVAAEELFGLMPERSVAAWNALITGYAHCGELNRALDVFDEMWLESVKPNQVTMAVVISVCGQLGALEAVKWMHQYLERSGMEMNVHVFNSLIDAYAKCGCVDDAYRLFCGMAMRDAVSYNVMIVSLGNCGHVELALWLFAELLKSGMQPDRITFLGVLTTCSHAGLLNLGYQYFNHMTEKYSIEPSVDHYACIVDLLGRAGFVWDAYELVKTMTVEPHAGVWGALLSACSMHNNVEVAEIASQRLFVVEPENPGNYVLLSNIYAKAQMWEDAARVRRMMRGKGLSKTAGCSWIEVDTKVHQFMIEDTDHPMFHDICLMLKHLSLQLASDGCVLDSDLHCTSSNTYVEAIQN